MTNENTNKTGPAARQPLDLSLLARVGVTAVFLAVTALIAAPFLSSLTWALILAVVFLRPHRAIESLTGPSLGAAISVLLLAVIVVAPLILVSQRLIAEAIAGAGYIQSEIAAGKWGRVLEAHPSLRGVNEWLEAQFDLQEVIGRAIAFLTNFGASLIKQSTGQAVTMLLSFYLLFFFLRDRRAGVETILRLSPFSNRETRKIILRVRNTITAIIYGTIAVAALQGALGGFMFWWLGFASPVTWALIMGLLSVVPVLGTFVVWIPATIFLALEGRWGEAITLGLWGGVVIASADNLIRPLLVGDTLRLHTASTFVALLGGLHVFGPPGVVLGPIAMTTSTLLLELWRRRADADVQAS